VGAREAEEGLSTAIREKRHSSSISMSMPLIQYTTSRRTYGTVYGSCARRWRGGGLAGSRLHSKSLLLPRVRPGWLQLCLAEMKAEGGLIYCPLWQDRSQSTNQYCGPAARYHHSFRPQADKPCHAAAIAQVRFPNVPNPRRIYACMRIYAYICVYTCVYMCIHVYTCVYICVYIHICVYTHMYACIYPTALPLSSSKCKCVVRKSCAARLLLISVKFAADPRISSQTNSEYLFVPASRQKTLWLAVVCGVARLWMLLICLIRGAIYADILDSPSLSIVAVCTGRSVYFAASQSALAHATLPGEWTLVVDCRE
jgi:hypothetical protein